MSDGTGASEGDKDTTVLIVDDNEQLRDLYSRQLEARYRVMTATEGEEALAMIDETVDVVVLDRCMPVLSGDEVFDRLVEASSRPAVIMVTGMERDEPTPAPDELLVKPVEREELVTTIEAVTTRAQRALA
jgi:DNA-binding response OmpR family regulator